jgi:hypothetical protein
MIRFNIFCLTFLVNTFMFAQQGSDCVLEYATDQQPSACCNGIISTNPASASLPASEDNLLLNRFDWLRNYYPNPAYIADIHVGIQGSSSTPIDHPFLSLSSDYTFYSNVYAINGDISAHNMNWSNGWELMHADFGYKLPFNTVVNPNNTGFSQRTNAYMLFYNRYTGKLRLMTSPAAGASIDNTVVALYFDKLQYNNQSSSALLSHNYSRFRPLDQKTEVKQIVSNLPFATTKQWSGTDFQLAYDPCVCSRKSEIAFSFQDVDKSTIDMVGRIIGREVKLNDSGKSPLAFGQDFLASVSTDFQKPEDLVKAGMMVYQAIDQDVKSAYVSDNMKFIGALVKMGAMALGGINLSLPIPKEIYRFPGNASFLVKTNELTGKKDTTKSINLAGGLSAGVNFLSGSLTPEAPDITFSESEASFKGFITDYTGSAGNGSISLFHPGSNFHRNVNNTLITPWTKYPFYNEAPGLFALLTTPKIVWGKYMNPIDDTDWHQQETVISQLTPFSTLSRIEYINTDSPDKLYNEGLAMAVQDKLVYALNPAAGIDETKTEIYAAIEFDHYDMRPSEIYHVNFQQVGGKAYNNLRLAKDEIFQIQQNVLQKTRYAVTKNKPNPYQSSQSYESYGGMFGSDIDDPYSLGTKLNDTLAYDFSSSIAEILAPSFNLTNTSFVKYKDYIAMGFGDAFSDQYHEETVRKVTFQSSFLPIDKIHTLKFVEYFKSLHGMTRSDVSYQRNADFRIKIVAKYQFKDNGVKVPEPVIQVYTYYVDVENTEFKNLSDCSISTKPSLCNRTMYSALSVPDTLYFTSGSLTPGTYSANNVVILGNVASSDLVSINARNSINIVNNGTVSPNITLNITSSPLAHESLAPAAASMVKSFCSSKYKADQLLNKNRELPATKEKENRILHNAISASPVPFTTTCFVNYTLQYDESARIYVSNMLGQKITVLASEEIQEAGQYQLDWDATKVQSGIYFITIETPSFKETIKVIKE